MQKHAPDAQLLTEFLNLEIPKQAPADGKWPQAFLKVFPHRIDRLNEFPALLKSIRDVHGKIEKDALPLIEPAKYGSTYVEDHLYRLVEKINDLHLPTRVAVQRNPSTRPKRHRHSAPSTIVWTPPEHTFNLANARWAVFQYRQDVEVSLEHEWYRLLLTCLQNGDIEKIKRCPQCSNLYVRIDPRAKFCSLTCRWHFNNAKRKKRGLANKWRGEEKAARIEIALKQYQQYRKLDRSSLESVAKDNGLSLRVLKQAINQKGVL